MPPKRKRRDKSPIQVYDFSGRRPFCEPISAIQYFKSPRRTICRVGCFGNNYRCPCTNLSNAIVFRRRRCHVCVLRCCVCMVHCFCRLPASFSNLGTSSLSLGNKISFYVLVGLHCIWLHDRPFAFRNVTLAPGIYGLLRSILGWEANGCPFNSWRA